MPGELIGIPGTLFRFLKDNKFYAEIKPEIFDGLLAQISVYRVKLPRFLEKPRAGHRARPAISGIGTVADLTMAQSQSFLYDQTGCPFAGGRALMKHPQVCFRPRKSRLKTAPTIYDSAMDQW
jgi:hypothetical protein